MLSKAKYKTKYGEGLKILSPKQMLQRRSIALAQIKSSNNSKRLLNGIKQIVYSLYQSKEITKRVYNNIIKSKQRKHYVFMLGNNIFMNSKNSKTSKTHVPILQRTDKLDLRRGEKSITLSNLSIYYM